MKITREEFKELVKLYNDTYESVKEIEPYVSDKVIDKLFPVLNWITERLGISEGDYDLLHDLYCYNQVPIDWDFEDGIWTNIVYSNDLDEIYDKYLSE